MGKKKKIPDSPVAHSIESSYRDGFFKSSVIEFKVGTDNSSDEPLKNRIFYNSTYARFEFEDFDRNVLYESAYMSSADLKMIAKELLKVADDMNEQYHAEE